MLARDYAAAGELSTCRRLIVNIRDYFTSGLAYLEAQNDDLLRQALVDLVDVFPGIAGVHSRFAIPRQEVAVDDAEKDPEPLPPVAAIERVITEEEGKTYRARAALVKTLEGPFDTKNFQGFTFANPVPVLSADGRNIGFANLEWDGRQLMAEVVIEYASQERLLAETGQKIYARPEGYVALAASKNAYVDFQELIEVTHARIEAIRLTTDAPRDVSIDPLGKPVV